MVVVSYLTGSIHGGEGAQHSPWWRTTPSPVEVNREQGPWMIFQGEGFFLQPGAGNSYGGVRGSAEHTTLGDSAEHTTLGDSAEHTTLGDSAEHTT